MVDEATTPESFKKGEAFENFVREKLFISTYYDLVAKTHNYRDNKADFVEVSMQPDYLFRDKRTKREFYVEVKFRSGFYRDKIEWCKSREQLKRYQIVNKSKPVFLALGIGGEPNNPEYICIIPMEDIKYTGLFESFLNNYVVMKNTPVSSKTLWS